MESEYQKLRQHWYKQLKKSGFVDIEESEWHPSELLKDFTLNEYETRRDFFLMASAFLYSGYKFGKHEWRIWELYAEGWRVPDILGHTPLRLDQVKYIIRKLKAKMFEHNQEISQ